jgi:hypothetical protein
MWMAVFWVVTPCSIATTNKTSCRNESALKMEAIYSSESLVTAYKATRPEYYDPNIIYITETTVDKLWDTFHCS